MNTRTRFHLLTLAIAVLASASTAPALEFFVSPDGSEANPGTVEQPFATLEQARDAVRRLRPSQPPAAGTVTIWLRGGDHLRTNALELTASDSGTAEAPVVWRSYRHETARLLGGRALAGFRPVTDPEVLMRLDEMARSSVRQIDLRALGILDFGTMQSRGFGRPTTVAHCELFCEGKPMPQRFSF